ncbi:hypothetical protein GCM10027299_12780 [Larkinella ripae]
MALCFAAAVPSQGQSLTEDDKVKKVIVDTFQAIADLNLPKLRSYCQADFSLLEDGAVWNIDSLETRLKPRIGTDLKRINTIHFIRVTIKGPIAWVSYYNSAAIAMNGKQRQVRWLESAVLENNKGDWKLALLHSTVLKPDQ